MFVRNSTEKILFRNKPNDQGERSKKVSNREFLVKTNFALIVLIHFVILQISWKLQLPMLTREKHEKLLLACSLVLHAKLGDGMMLATVLTQCLRRRPAPNLY